MWKNSVRFECAILDKIKLIFYIRINNYRYINNIDLLIYILLLLLYYVLLKCINIYKLYLFINIY